MIDKVRLTSILELDHLEMTRVILSIFERIPESLEEVRACCLKKNRNQISFVAHTLKGETASFGLIGLSKLFAILEEKAEEISFEEIENYLSEIIIVNNASYQEFNKKHSLGKDK